MEKLKYYKNLSDGTVFAYERQTEFFALYSSHTKQWHQPDNITFMQLTHDCDHVPISKEDAFKEADGGALEALFREYVALIEENRRVK